MGKRKKSLPRKANDEKRRLMTWNLYDGCQGNQGSLAICDDNDPELLKELQNSINNDKNCVTSSSSSREKSSITDNAQIQAIFDSLLETCTHCVSIRRQLLVKANDWCKQIASFSFVITEGNLLFDFTSDCLTETDEFWLYVGDECCKSFVYTEAELAGGQKHCKFWGISCDIPVEVLGAFEEKVFQLVLDRYDEPTKSLHVGAYIRHTALVDVKFPCEAVKRRKHGPAIQRVMGHFYGVKTEEYTGAYSRKHDIEDLYIAVKAYHNNEMQKQKGKKRDNLQHPYLIPRLRRYQKEAVQWMLDQENTEVNKPDENEHHMLYSKVKLVDGTDILYNRHVGCFTLTNFPAAKRLPGGILADEMGLGKTVEVLACIMLHPRTDLENTIKDVEAKTGKTGSNKMPQLDEVNNITVDKNNICDENVINKNGGVCDRSSDMDTYYANATNSEKVSEQQGPGDHSESRESKNVIPLNDLKHDNVTPEPVSDKCSQRSSGKDTYCVSTKICDEKSQEICNKKPDSDSLNNVGTVDNNPTKRNRFRRGSVEEIAISKGIFDNQAPASQKTFFECICGMKEEDAFKKDNTKKNNVQCVRCGLWQHAECVHFNISDPDKADFVCPHCLVEGVPLKSGATLIVSPTYICHQWVDEILKHIQDQSLKVMVYTGVSKQGFVQPWTLAQQDIVITTYETLRTEINFLDLPHSNSESGRKFRHPKRFMTIPSPMTAVEWWRVCLDEAQMVECTTTKTAMMALRLTTVNRWCVTGTPIQGCVKDLYGLFLFLGIDPYWVEQWFYSLLYNPLCCGVTKPMYDVVASTLWRSAKKDVIDQINLPEQTEHVHWLTFSPVEDHFYRRQYQDCVRDSMKRLSKWTDNSTKLSSLDRHTMNQLLYPLLRLRQACCHPQAVRGEFLPLQKSTMTMEELLESLTKKAQTECEEAHRQIVAALNGQAGLHIIKEEYIEAIERYREVLRSVEEYKEQLRTDELQQLHTLHNLKEILSLKPSGLQPTLRDSQIDEQTKDIRHRYMTRAETKVTQAQHHLKGIQDTLNDLKDEANSIEFGGDWWISIIDTVDSRGIGNELVTHIKDDLYDNSGNLGPHMSMANMFRDTNGLELIVVQKLEALESAREKLMTSLNKLSKGLTPTIISQTVECCLRPVEEVSGDCPFCDTDKDFQDYEAKLYSFTEQGLVVSGDQYQVGTRRQGTWADSQVERTLKAIISFAKQRRVDPYLVSFGLAHIKVFEGMKKEFKGCRSVWMCLREQVSSIDELEMATTRLRLRLPREPEPTTAQLHILEPSALEHQKQKLKSDLIVGKCELRKKLGQLLYLKNLAKTRDENSDGHNPEPCPICQRELGVEWSVMHCGHCYCLDCMNILLERYSFGGRNRVVKCAICREITYRSDVSFVSTKKCSNDKDIQDFNIKGSHSTKVQGIVKQMIKIHHKDPEAKMLVFSTWVDVLNVLSSALIENSFDHRLLYHGHKFQQNLNAFKEDKNITALLLPVASGANGLNLIEATYVILVEPILNPAQELQAIGRVHRIGQTKPTEVHRFLIRGTVEQKMYNILKTIESTASSHDTEENSLTIGDITSLLSEEQRDQDQANDYTEEPEDRSGNDDELMMSFDEEYSDAVHSFEDFESDEAILNQDESFENNVASDVINDEEPVRSSDTELTYDSFPLIDSVVPLSSEVTDESNQDQPLSNTEVRVQRSEDRELMGSSDTKWTAESIHGMDGIEPVASDFTEDSSRVPVQDSEDRPIRTDLIGRQNNPTESDVSIRDAAEVCEANVLPGNDNTLIPSDNIEDGLRDLTQSGLIQHVDDSLSQWKF